MENKQIIIDGVDVSGCKNFSCGKCEEENKIPITINHFTADCRMYPNCYYKQLKHKEQECEEKSWEIGNLGYKIKNQRKEINIRLQQLDQLKGENVGVLKQLEFVRTLNTVQEAEIRKLTKTLTETKEIAKNSCCLQPTSTCEEYENCKECSRTSDDETVKQIIQKISEVEDVKSVL